MPLPPYKAFKNSLGRFNSFCQLQEIAIRDLERRAEQIDGSFSQFLTNLSRAHEINTRFETFPPLVDFRCKFYLISNVAQFEGFLQQLEEFLTNNGMSKLFGTTRDLNDRLAILSKMFDANRAAKALLDVIHYYRLIRNYSVHPFNSAQVRGELYGRLMEIDRSFFSGPEFAAQSPSSCDKIQFQDFLLCSQAMKQFAFILCETVRRQHDWVGEKAYVFSKFGKFVTKPARLNNAISGYLRTRFGLDESEAKYIMQTKLGVQA